MKIAVTGATGFIGRHVVAELTRRSLSSVVVSRRGMPMSTHIAAAIDLRDPPDNVFERIGSPDVLIHLAWGGLPNYKSLDHFELELPAQYRFLKSMVNSGLRNLFVTGTCFEYGMQSGPLAEDRMTNPITPYGLAKDSLRRQLEYLQRTVPFNLTWARLFYVFGEGQAQTSLLPALKRAVEQGREAFDMSEGEQLRDYMPATAAADALVSLALQARDNGIVNVCSGNPVSVRRLVEEWVEQSGWSIRLNLGLYPYADYEPMAFWGDCRKLLECLGAAPRHADI